MKKHIIIAHLAFVFALVSLSCDKEESPAAPSDMGTIAGRVFDSQNGASIKGVYITSKNSTHAVATDVDGSYLLIDVKPGVFTLYASKIGYDSASVSVNVQAGLTTTADFILHQTKYGNIEGYIKNASDSIGKKFIVSALIETSPFAGSTSTDTAGKYRLRNIKTGKYKLTVSHGYFASKTLDIEVFPDTTINVDVTLNPIYGIITGIVRDENNGPLKGVVITTTPGTSSVGTDSLGYYRIDYIKPPESSSKYTIKAERKDYVSQTKDVNVIPGTATKGDFILVKTSP